MIRAVDNGTYGDQGKLNVNSDDAIGRIGDGNVDDAINEYDPDYGYLNDDADIHDTDDLRDCHDNNIIVYNSTVDGCGGALVTGTVHISP